MTKTTAEIQARLAELKSEQRAADLERIRKDLAQAKDLVDVSLTLLARIEEK